MHKGYATMTDPTDAMAGFYKHIVVERRSYWRYLQSITGSDFPLSFKSILPSYACEPLQKSAVRRRKPILYKES